MRSRRVTLWGLLCLVLLVLPALSVEPDEMLPDPAQEARARALSRELRCVVCQNQSVDDSDAPLARDIRVIVRERIAAGASDEEARDFVVARYGKFVLLNPPLAADTFIVWVGPFILFFAGLGLAAYYVRRAGPRLTSPAPLTADDEDIIARRLDEAGS